MKFGRRYRITIELEDDKALVIEPPLSIKFNIQRSSMATTNMMTLEIFNLSQTRREEIFQDRFNFLNQKKIIVEAGYAELSTVFVGQIFQASSARAGTDIITNIVARDGFGDTRNTFTSATFPAGYSLQDLFKKLIGEFPNISEGKIGNIEGTFKRPVTVNGNTFEILNTYSENRTFVDLDEINVMKGEEVIEGNVPSFNTETGLLATPRREGSYMTVTTLFEPAINMSQLIEFNSPILQEFNGQYKVIGVHHSGTISEAVSETCKSTFNLLLGEQLYNKRYEVLS